MPSQQSRHAIGQHDFSTLWSDFTAAFLTHSARTPEHLAALISGSRHPIGPIAKGYLLLLLAKAEMRPAAVAALAEARRRGADAMDARTRALADGLSAWLAGYPRRAVVFIEQVISRNPQDAFAVKLSHAIRFLLGDADGMRRSLARVVSIYTEEVPFAGYVKGCYAFALEETGDYREAERMGRRAIALAPDDAWGRHAVAHVMEMTGRAEDGLDWLANDGDWRHCNNFSFHMLWHRALFLLELGRTCEALRLYDLGMRAEETDDFRDIANAASLLQRLELCGVAVGARWEELAGPAADALIAFAAGDSAETVRRLAPVMPFLRMIGGSHAQRDIFEQIWLESLVRSGHPLAESQLHYRLAARGGRNAFARERLQRLATQRGQGEGVAAALLLTPETQLH
jgi:tetratricopeptide (TPR) repeat protein